MKTTPLPPLRSIIMTLSWMFLLVGGGMLHAQCLPAPAGLVSWWRGEGNASDSSGTNNGSAFGGLSYTNGEVGQAFVFNNGNSYIQVAASSSLNLGTNGGFTIEGWIKPSYNSQGTAMPIIEWDSSSAAGLMLWAESGNKIYAAIIDTLGNNHALSSTNDLLTSNSWQHVALTYNKASGAGVLYCNGSVVVTNNLGNFTPQTAYPVIIGRRTAAITGQGMTYSGLMDELSLYNRALSASELQAVYSAGIAGKCYTPVLPAITAQPTNQTTVAGLTATFSVSVTGSAPLSYQWKFGTTNIPNATNTTLTLGNVQLTNAGSYSVYISNPYGSTNSASAVLTVALPSCVPAPAGLASWWRSEGDAYDSVGTNNGSAVGNIAYANGEVGQAFVFNNSSYIPLAASSSLNLGTNGGFTIEGWIKPVYSAAAAMPIIEWDAASAAGLMLWAESGHKIFASIVDTLGNNHMLTSANDLLNTNSWQHVALTYNKASGAGVLYYNGAVVVTNNLGSFTPQTTYPANIGRRTAAVTGQGTSFNGLMDELSLYNRALSAAEVQSVYAAGTAGKCYTPIIPPPHSATGTATLAFGFVVNVNVTDGGYGYTNAPVVRIIGAGGSGAQAVAVVSNGVVIAVNIINPGSGYPTNATVVIIDPPFIFNPVLAIAPMSLLSFSNLTLGGTYQLQQAVLWYWTNRQVGFTATNANFTQLVAGVAGSDNYRLALSPVPSQAFAIPQVVNGFVVGGIVTSGGSGYVTSPEVSIVGGGGTNATAVSHITGGVVTSITIMSTGFGYTNMPTIKVAQPPAAAVSPTVLPVMRLDAAILAPYHDYQVQFKPDLGSTWEDWNGGLFTPPSVTNSQYIFITNDLGFFRLLYVP